MGLNEFGELLAPRDERFPVEVRADLPLVEPQGETGLSTVAASRR